MNRCMIIFSFLQLCQAVLHAIACFFSVVSTRNMTCEATGDMLLVMSQSIVPSLTRQLYKGQCGRIAVMGGCQE